MAKRPRKNRALIVVYFPDGCRLELESRRDVSIADDARQFGEWLAETGAEIIDRCSDGQCGKARSEGQ